MEKSIINEIDKQQYTRKPLEIMEYGSTIATRALLMGRYGMLACKANFSCGTNNKNCQTVDDENHRINFCPKYENINLYHSNVKLDYNLIYADKISVSLKIVDMILRIWDLGNGKNVMRT